MRSPCRSKRQHARVCRVSKANAKQRAGRSGRVQEGTCYRLYPMEVFQQLDSHMAPEMQRMPLEAVVLQLKSIGALLRRHLPAASACNRSASHPSRQPITRRCVCVVSGWWRPCRAARWDSAADQVKAAPGVLCCVRHAVRRLFIDPCSAPPSA